MMMSPLPFSRIFVIKTFPICFLCQLSYLLRHIFLIVLLEECVLCTCSHNERRKIYHYVSKHNIRNTEWFLMCDRLEHSLLIISQSLHEYPRLLSTMKVSNTLSTSFTLLSLSTNVQSFQSNQPPMASKFSQRTRLSASQIGTNDEIDVDAIKEAVKDIDLDSIKEAVKSNNKNNDKFSQAIPFLYRPPILTGELAGDVGFDPLQLSKNREQLYYYREAEIKHARLAMLVSIPFLFPS